MKFNKFIDDPNFCVAAKVYIPRIDYEFILLGINYDHLVEIINEIKHFNKGASVLDMSYLDDIYPVKEND